MRDYTQLQADITDWFARDDLNTALFIALAETECNRVLRLQGQESMASAIPQYQTANDYYYVTPPADMLELDHIESGGQRYEFLTVNQMTTDADGYFTQANGMILVTGTDELDIYYFASIPELSSGNATNLLTDVAYDGLFYSCLAHGASYMGRDPSMFRAQAKEYLQEVKRMDDKARYSGAPLVMRG